MIRWLTLTVVVAIPITSAAGVMSIDANVAGQATGTAIQDNSIGVMQVYAPKSSGRLARVDVRVNATVPGKGNFLYGFHALDEAGNLRPQEYFAVGGGATGKQVDDAAGGWLSIVVNGDRRVAAGQRYGLLFGGNHAAFETTDAAGGLSLWDMLPPVGPVQPESGRSLLYRVVLEIDSAAGDANQDGRVDLSDFGTLKASFGMEGSWADGDFTGDGRVDLSDFGELKAGFGRPAASVPEPASWLIAGMAASGLAWTVGAGNRRTSS